MTRGKIGTEKLIGKKVTHPPEKYLRITNVVSELGVGYNDLFPEAYATYS